MKFLLSTNCLQDQKKPFHQTLKETITAMDEYQFKGLEVVIPSHNTLLTQKEYDLLSTVRIQNVHAPLFLNYPLRGLFKPFIKSMVMKTISVAHKCNADNVIFDPFIYYKDKKTTTQLMQKVFSELTKYQLNYLITTPKKIKTPKYCLATQQEVYDFCEDKLLAMNLNVLNAISHDVTQPHQCVEKYFEKIKNIHISDTNQGMLGKGLVKVGDLFDALKRNSYDHYITLEGNNLSKSLIEHNKKIMDKNLM